jgi:cytochrome c-type biogenesis protein CcmE
MKKTHIIGILLIAVCIAIVVGSLYDASSYANFDKAFTNPGEEYHVVGKLDTTKPVVYEPGKNPNLTVFHMFDENNVSRRVELYKSKPQDFERSETIVLIGSAGGDEETFEANNILLKCPSKYEDGGQIETAEYQDQ